MKDALGGVQSVLVLGAGSDIARATTRRLVAGRARTVVLGARDVARLEALVAELRGAGAERVETIAFDALAVDTHAGIVDDVFDRVGDIDVVLLAFGVLGEQERSEADGAAAVEVLATNFTGAVSIAIPAVRRLRAQGHGSLVVLSSVSGERARRANFVYGSSKAGMDAFFQGMSDSLVGSGVEVIVVRPGFVHTKMTAGMPPAPGATTAEAVAGAIVAALGRGSRTIWVPAMMRYVMSALRHLPRPVFRRLRG